MQNMITKIKCPHCGSTNILFFQEYTITRHFKLKKNGEPYKRPIKEYYNKEDGGMPAGYQCQDCKAFASIWNEDIKDWEEIKK